MAPSYSLSLGNGYLNEMYLPFIADLNAYVSFSLFTTVPRSAMWYVSSTRLPLIHHVTEGSGRPGEFQ
jgi:type III secretory pathway component EscV